jgi:hypothetical protein
MLFAATRTRSAIGTLVCANEQMFLVFHRKGQFANKGKD